MAKDIDKKIQIISDWNTYVGIIATKQADLTPEELMFFKISSYVIVHNIVAMVIHAWDPKNKVECNVKEKNLITTYLNNSNDDSTVQLDSLNFFIDLSPSNRKAKMDRTTAAHSIYASEKYVQVIRINDIKAHSDRIMQKSLDILQQLQ